MKNHLFLLLIVLCRIQTIQAQSTNDFNIKGRIEIAHEYYKMSSNYPEAIARKPNNLTRLVFAPTLQWKKFSLPFMVMLSSQGTNTITPPDAFSEAYALFNQIKSFEDLKTYAQNPINRIGIAPKFKNFQLFAGTHTPVYSELTQGNISIFGGGFMWKPGKFFIGANYGVSQNGIEQDSIKRIAGAYQRVQYGARLGFGTPQKSFFALNITGGRDDINSITTPLTTINPEEGLSTSLEYRLRFGKSLTVGGEIAGGLFTSDLNQYEIDFEEALGITIPSFITYNLSTRFDGAATAYVDFKQKNWSVKTKGMYIGQGYKTFGYPFFQSDRLEWTVSPRFSLFKKKVNVSGSIGSRTNNLNGTKAAPMTQLLASANINAQVNNYLNINGTYSNFGIRSTIDNDTLRIENVSQNISVSPTLIFNKEKAMNIFSVIFSIDDFEDYNIVSGELNNNQSLVAGLTYNRSWKAKPLTITGNFMRFQLNSTQIKIDNTTIGSTVGYSFFDKKLTTSAGLTYLLNKPEENATYDKQFLFDFRLKYKHPKRYSLSLQASNNAYAFGSTRPNAKLTETNFRVILGKRF